MQLAWDLVHLSSDVDDGDNSAWQLEITVKYWLNIKNKIKSIYFDLIVKYTFNV